MKFPRLLSALAFVATLIVAAYGAGVLSDGQMKVAYEPCAWLCLNVPGFVEEHERWIEVVGMLRTAWMAFVWQRRSI